MTTGIIGKLEIDGRQVGGFKDWEIDVAIRRGNSSTTITAESYWLFERVKTATATFYFNLNGELIIANQESVSLDLPEVYSLNKLIKAPLKMMFNGHE